MESSFSLYNGLSQVQTSVLRRRERGGNSHGTRAPPDLCHFAPTTSTKDVRSFHIDARHYYLDSPRFEAVVMPLFGDPTVTKLQKDSNMVSQLAIGREVLNLDCGNASPVHLERNSVTVP